MHVAVMMMVVEGGEREIRWYSMRNSFVREYSSLSISTTFTHHHHRHDLLRCVLNTAFYRKGVMLREWKKESKESVLHHHQHHCNVMYGYNGPYISSRCVCICVSVCVCVWVPCRAISSQQSNSQFTFYLFCLFTRSFIAKSLWGIRIGIKGHSRHMRSLPRFLALTRSQFLNLTLVVFPPPPHLFSHECVHTSLLSSFISSRPNHHCFWHERSK